MWKLIVFVAAFVSLLSLAVSPVSAIAISQIEFDLSLAAGSTASYSFQVANNEAQAQKVTIYLSDWLLTPTGDYDFLPLNGARWRFSREFQTGEEMEILYRINLPASGLTVAGGYVCTSPSAQGKTAGETLLSPSQSERPSSPTAEEPLSVTREITDVSPEGDFLTVRLRILIMQNFTGLTIDEVFSSHADITPLDSAGGSFDTVNRSIGDWLVVNPRRFTLNEGEVQEVTLRIKVPPEAEGAYWGMIFVEATPRQEESLGTAVIAIQRFGVKVYATVPGTEVLSGKVTCLRDTEHDPLSFDLCFTNTGNVLIRARGRGDIINQSGKTVRSLAVEEFVVLPNGVCHLNIVDTSAGLLSPGVYRALFVIDYGGDRFAGGTRDFRIK